MQTVSIVGERRKSIESTFALTRSILLRKEPISHSALVLRATLCPITGAAGERASSGEFFYFFSYRPGKHYTLCLIFSGPSFSLSHTHTHPLSALYRAAQQ